MSGFFSRHPGFKRLIPGPLTLVLILAIVYLWFRPPAWITHPQRPVPDITVQMMDGHTLALSSLRGQVVLVNFWASWCPYCLHELPQIRTFYRDWHARGFTVLTLSLDDNPQLAVQYLREHRDDLPAGLSNAAVERAFGGISKLPTSFIIDRQGIIRDRIAGQVYYGRLQDMVEPLLEKR